MNIEELLEIYKALNRELEEFEPSRADAIKDELESIKNKIKEEQQMILPYMHKLCIYKFSQFH